MPAFYHQAGGEEAGGSYGASAHADARIAALERQLAFFRQLALQNNQILAETREVLAAVRHPEAGPLVRRLDVLAERQGAALRGGRTTVDGADAAAPEPSARRIQLTNEERGNGRLASPRGVPPAAEDVVREVTRRLAAACDRLAGAWMSARAAGVSRLLARPVAAFDVFHDAPTEAALESFLAAFRSATEDVRKLLAESESPFADDRTIKMFTDAVQEAVEQAVELTEAAPFAAPAQEPPQHRNGGLNATPTAAPVTETRGGGRVAPSLPLAPHDVRRGAIQRPETPQGSAPAGAPPHQDLGTPSVARHTPRAATPSRFNRAAHDSSQMRESMFGAGAGTPAADAPPRRQANESSEVTALRNQLAQLELQLGLITGRRGDTGSESRYYGLTRKVQKVRAELLAKLREEDELRAVTDAVNEQRRLRELDRRTFGR